MSGSPPDLVAPTYAAVNRPLLAGYEDDPRDDGSEHRERSVDPPMCGVCMPVQRCWATRLSTRYHDGVLAFSFAGLLLFWVVVFYVNNYTGSTDLGPPTLLTCRNTYWPGSKDAGIDAGFIKPSVTDWFPIMCPPKCRFQSGLSLYGSGNYTLSSTVCWAAMHAGVVGNNGGCAQMRFTGSHTGWSGTSQNGIESAEYPSWFPVGMEFSPIGASLCEQRPWLILVAFVLSQLLVAHLQPPKWLSFGYHIFVGYWVVAFSSEADLTDYYAQFINGTSNIGLLMFFGPVLYYIGHPAIPEPTQPWRSFALYALWFDFLLTVNNLVVYLPWLNFSLDSSIFDGGAGRVIAVLAVLVIFLALVAYYVRLLYKEGHLKYYLIGSLAVIVAIVITSILFRDHASIHIHHCLIPILLWPFVRYPRRTVVTCCQAILLGMFINGLAAWGWDPLWDLVSSSSGGVTLPKPEAPFILANGTRALTLGWIPWWNETAAGPGALGSVLSMNGVDIYRGYDRWNWTRTGLLPNTTYEFKLQYYYAYNSDGSPSDGLHTWTQAVNGTANSTATDGW